MTILRKDIFQVLLFSILLITIPMFYFPEKFGMDLATSSFTYSIFEIFFYGVLFYIFRPSATLLQLFQGAGLTFLYRIVLGTIFGFLLWIIFGMEFTVSLALGVSKYLPAIILHIIAAPFIMRPFFVSIVDEVTAPGRRDRRSRKTGRDDFGSELPAPYLPRSEGKFGESFHDDSPVSMTNVPVNHDINGFERSVRYLGEHHAVLLAAVVDSEGLTTAVFKRGEIDPELWAPISLLLRDVNERLLGRNEKRYRLDNLDLSFGPHRLSVIKISSFSLLVLSNREEDELLNIRIKQAAEMIRRYSSERYGALLPTGTEEKYVSNT
jgi:hypothetical protein